MSPAASGWATISSSQDFVMSAVGVDDSTTRSASLFSCSVSLPMRSIKPARTRAFSVARLGVRLTLGDELVEGLRRQRLLQRVDDAVQKLLGRHAA